MHVGNMYVAARHVGDYERHGIPPFSILTHRLGGMPCKLVESAQIFWYFPPSYLSSMLCLAAASRCLASSNDGVRPPQIGLRLILYCELIGPRACPNLRWPA